MTSRILIGDCRDILKTLEAGSVHSIVCDPPYELGFMGKSWDGTGVAFDPATWTACKRVLMPGGYLLAFGGTRTYHRMAVAIEDAGLEIKDCLCWLYGSGFPKHKSLLKPAWEPIVLAKKRGAGTLNVDECRIAGDVPKTVQGASSRVFGNGKGFAPEGYQESDPSPLGRWPANVVIDEVAAEILDEQSGELTSGSWNGLRTKPKENTIYGKFGTIEETPLIGSTGGASRFFYVAKADRSERDKGLEGTVKRQVGMISETSGQHVTRRDGGAPKPAHNDHPTVKPVDLMSWLVRLVTPPGGTVLDPFMGSGSTGIAADRQGFDFIGIEENAHYAEIARLRIIGDSPMFAEVLVS